MLDNRKFYRRFLVVGFMLIVSAATAQNSPYSTISDRIVLDLQKGLNDDFLARQVVQSFSSLNPDGSWSDINYADAQYDPLKRIKEAVTAYIRPSNKLYGKSEIYTSIVKSLKNWGDRNPKNKNWWYNDIFYPQAIGQILLLMRHGEIPIPEALERTLIQRMQRKLRVGDGANTSDEALHYLYRACLTQNAATLDSAATYLFEPIAVEDGKEGVQVDGSYFQHGKQQAIASYGKVFVANSIDAAYYLRGTAYAIPTKKLTILVDYLKDTFLKSIRGSFYDFNVRGRGISRKDSLSASILNMVEKIKMFDPENAAYWEASALRIANQKSSSFAINPSHKHYWKSGYTLHIRPYYTFSIQTASLRTLRTERGNNENIFGNFLSDGATNIQRSGSEYSNIMPIWEWDKIPGTTSRNYPTDSGATIKKEWGIPGTTKFVGGVSDGLYGVSAYDLDQDNVKAKKSWFFFDREIVCLGAGIKSTSSEPVTTTINQAWSRGNVQSVEKDKKSVIQTNQGLQNEKLSWISQDSITYFFPKSSAIQLSNQLQTGNWSRINHFQSEEEEKGHVFKLWFNHGIKPTSATYEYIVLPGVTNHEEIKTECAMIQILKNTEDVQAVKHIGLHMVQVVFYKPGILKSNGLSVEANQACIIYIKDLDKQQPYLYIADPTQEHTTIKVGIKLPSFNASKIMNCTMPVEALAGSTASFKIPI